jgi:tripartite-type tricarboxylate transporter receptor subunit TctC
MTKKLNWLTTPNQPQPGSRAATRRFAAPEREPSFESSLPGRNLIIHHASGWHQANLVSQGCHIAANATKSPQNLQLPHQIKLYSRRNVMMFKRAISVLLAASGLCTAVGVFAAESFPSRPLRVLAPNGPGSSVDTLTRIVTNRLSEVLGQNIVVDNRAGAGGVIGMEIGKDANPDGYTLLTATTAASTIARLMLKNPPYHPINDYDSVAQFAVTLNVLVVANSLPVNSVPELIAYAKSGKKPFNMASAGVGSQSHLSGAYFVQEAKINSLHVPYKGGGASSRSVASGESQWSLIPSAAAMNHVAAKRMRAIGHSLNKPTPLLPNIRPISDTIPGFDYTGWMGFFVPKGTPKAIIETLRAAVAKTMEAPDVKKGMAFQATEIVVLGPDAFRKEVQKSMIKNAALVKTVGLKGN